VRDPQEHPGFSTAREQDGTYTQSFETLLRLHEQRPVNNSVLDPYLLVREEFNLSGVPWKLWKVREMDQALDLLAAKAADHPDVVDERMPYWAELWPSALVLAEAVLRSEALPAGPWLELGCGPGLPGITATHRGMRGIWTDYMEEALALTERNARENGVSHPLTFQLDWRHPPQGLNVAWILGSDLLYEARNFSPLLNCLDQLLAPGGQVWISEPGRSVADEFWSLAARHHWRRERIFTGKTANIYSLHRNAPPASSSGSPFPIRDDEVR
jgi:predicted nicotinamide N-methyase